MSVMSISSTVPTSTECSAGIKRIRDEQKELNFEIPQDIIKAIMLRCDLPERSLLGSASKKCLESFNDNSLWLFISDLLEIPKKNCGPKKVKSFVLKTKEQLKKFSYTKYLVDEEFNRLLSSKKIEDLIKQKDLKKAVNTFNFWKYLAFQAQILIDFRLQISIAEFHRRIQGFPTWFQNHLENLLPLEQIRFNNNYKLNSLPAEIGQLTQLKKLILMSHNLTSLSTEIGKLEQLQTLMLCFNRLTSLPVEMGKLAQLEELNLMSNKLTSLFAEIGKLEQLKVLILCYNRLISLPAEMGKLAQLNELYLGNNNLTLLPTEVGQLAQLKKLDLNNNQLISLPVEIGQLQQLEELNLKSNQLTSLPIEIGQLVQLKELNLINNPLNSLPVEIWRLPKLEKLFIDKKSLTLLPPELEPWEYISFYIQEDEYDKPNLTSPNAIKLMLSIV